jgi:hypothetical protein
MSALRQYVIMPGLACIEKVAYFLIEMPFIGFYLNLCMSWCAGCTRMFAGSYATSNLESCKRPEKMIIFYQYEGCPFCRRVRETISALALDVLVYPCPRVTLSEYGVTGQR